MCDEKSCSPDSAAPQIKLSALKRRQFLQGVISLPLATILGVPGLALAAADKLERVYITAENGERSVGALALSEKLEGAPTVMLIHEWWGLNDQIKAVAQSFAEQGYIALAVDLYAGELATTGQQANTLMNAVDGQEAQQTLNTWVDYLRHYADESRSVGCIGWCFGGGWALNTALATQLDATVVYYGNMAKSAVQLSALKSPLLGHFATRDQWIDRAMLERFERQLAASGSSVRPEFHWYEADHAFANPTRARYDAEDTALAWQRTLDFLARYL
ncbi:MAG: dienelactone hydrolase family protein [Pseudomonadales bacterium]